MLIKFHFLFAQFLFLFLTLADINKLKFIHLEAEYVQFWQNQKLYSDVSNLLLGYGFKEAYKIDLGYDQCDTIWYKI